MKFLIPNGDKTFQVLTSNIEDKCETSTNITYCETSGIVISVSVGYAPSWEMSIYSKTPTKELHLKLETLTTYLATLAMPTFDYVNLIAKHLTTRELESLAFRGDAQFKGIACENFGHRLVMYKLLKQTEKNSSFNTIRPETK